ncbi:MAG: hypothetical protein M1829_001500 [Trizodia sp. TS-e1964]|nr:MAG: hypothetical protein M1829_001500 [Trizodia sp. TS-e1964]
MYPAVAEDALPRPSPVAREIFPRQSPAQRFQSPNLLRSVPVAPSSRCQVPAIPQPTDSLSSRKLARQRTLQYMAGFEPFNSRAGQLQEVTVQLEDHDGQITLLLECIVTLEARVQQAEHDRIIENRMLQASLNELSETIDALTQAVKDLMDATCKWRARM